MRKTIEAGKERTGIKMTVFFANIARNKEAYILLIPALLIVFTLQYIPYFGLVLAFKDFNIMDGIWGSKWVGFNNFIQIFNNKNMLHAIKNTFFYSSVITFGGFPFPIILAMLFNELKSKKFIKIVQTVSYMPYFLSWVSVIGMFYAFLATEGTLNQILVRFMGDDLVFENILMKSRFFLPVILMAHLWKNVGWSSVVFLAAIAGIDQSLYEAASIDGCGKLKQAWHVTLPGMKSTIAIVLIMSLSSLVKTNFEMVYGFQNVFIQEETEVIDTLIYRMGIQNGKYSLSTAFGLGQGLVSITIILMANTFSKKFFQTSIW